MAQSRHHYEQAFEEHLRARRIPYLSVNEARKALLPDGAAALARPAGGGGASAPGGSLSLKSFDFVVYGGRENLLLDIKGRRVPAGAGGAERGRGRLESWVTLDDIESLRRWRTLFGEGFDAAFVFVYWCEGQPPDALFQEVFERRERWYAVRAVRLDPYVEQMKTRSLRWRTVHVPGAAFERISQPFCAPLGEIPEEEAGPAAALQPIGAGLSSV